MNTRKPFVGETVLFSPNPNDEVARSNHNHDEVAAIVTRVWSEICVNIKIIPDCGPMQDRTSVVHYTANSAGYHFRFLGEDKYSETNSSPHQGNTEDTKDASAFLQQP